MRDPLAVERDRELAAAQYGDDFTDGNASGPAIMETNNEI